MMYDKFSSLAPDYHYFLVYTQTIFFPFNCPHKSFENKALNYRKKMKHLVNSYFTGTADYRPLTFRSKR